MKRIYFLVLALFAILGITDVGLAASSISDTDGNTKVDTEATPNNDQIRFSTAGTEQMRIDSVGRVGIWTSSPEQALDVRGNVQAVGDSSGSNYFYLQKYSSTNPWDRYSLLFYKARGTKASPSSVQSGDYVLSIEGSAYDGTGWDYAGGVNMKVNAVTNGVVESDLHFDTANQSAGTGRTVMTINKDGNVGIGTTSPSVRLHNNGDFITKGPWVDVRAFGAVGDGTTDDTTSIQNAINSLTSRGGTVYLPVGRYKITNTITLVPHLRLRGDGGRRGTSSGGTEILSYFNGNALSLSYPVDTMGNILIENLAITGDKTIYTSGYGIYLNHVFDVTISNVVVGLVKDDAFHVEYGWDIYFRDTYAGNMGGIGYYINSATSSLQRCVSDAGTYSLKIDAQGAPIAVIDGHFERATYGGILLDGNQGNRIIGNVITDTPKGIIDGTSPDGTIRAQIVGNRIILGGAALAGSIGISLTNDKSYDFVINSNHIVGFETGIKCYNWDYNIIDGNFVRAQTTGLDINGGSNPNIVSNNYIEGTTDSIKHNAGNKVTYTGNRLSKPINLVGGTPTIYNEGNAGSFTFAAANSTVVNNTSVTANSKIILFPTNANAATMVSGAKSPYISAKTAGVSFTVRTANSQAAAGTETFNYVIFD